MSDQSTRSICRQRNVFAFGRRSAYDVWKGGHLVAFSDFGAEDGRRHQRHNPYCLWILRRTLSYAGLLMRMEGE